MEVGSQLARAIPVSLGAVGLVEVKEEEFEQESFLAVVEMARGSQSLLSAWLSHHLPIH